MPRKKTKATTTGKKLPRKQIRKNGLPSTYDAFRPKVFKEQEVVLITGTSSGIGFETALLLAQKGYFVYATMRDLNKAEPLEREIQRLRLPITILPLDVTKEITIKRAVNNIDKKHGRIDYCINNAGFGLFGPIEESTEEEIFALLDVNVFGVHRVTRAVLPIMRRNRMGRIINISSIAGRVGIPMNGIYHASKAALEAITESLRYEIKQFGLSATCIEPGAIATNFSSSMASTAATLKSDSPYYALYNTVYKNLNKRSARYSAHAEVVAEVIYHAMTVAKPKLIYQAGKDARFIARVVDSLKHGFIERGVEWLFMKG